MAHGGHVGGGGSAGGGGAGNLRFLFMGHHNDDDDDDKIKFKDIVIIIIIILAVTLELCGCGKKALEGEYVTYSSYLVDDCNYFSNKDKLESSLEDFHEKTNIQIVVITSDQSWSDSKAVEKYYEMFTDEAHILIILPVKGSIIYYAIGDLADEVFGDKEIENLLNYTVRNSNDGEVWEKSLKSAADKFE